jgi:hypothetical protein
MADLLDLPSKVLKGTAAGVSDILRRLTEDTIRGVVARIQRAEQEGLNSVICALPHAFANTGGAPVEQVRQIVYGRTIEHISACSDGFTVQLFEIEKTDSRRTWELEVTWKPIIELGDLKRCTEIVRSVLTHIEEDPPADTM